MERLFLPPVTVDAYFDPGDTGRSARGVGNRGYIQSQL